MITRLNKTCLQISGQEASQFLQNMLSNDITQLDQKNFQLSCFCNPAGRVIALFEIIKQTDTCFLLIVSNELSHALIQQFTLYKLRSDVHITTLPLHCFGIIGDRCQTISQHSHIALPKSAYQQSNHKNTYLMQLPGKHTTCYQLITPKMPNITLEKDDKPWQTCQIKNGLVQINAKQSGKIIPQHACLEKFNTISFTKGCYPGQEIIARTHYLGKSAYKLYYQYIPNQALEKTLKCEKIKPLNQVSMETETLILGGTKRNNPPPKNAQIIN